MPDSLLGAIANLLVGAGLLYITGSVAIPLMKATIERLDRIERNQQELREAVTRGTRAASLCLGALRRADRLLWDQADDLEREIELEERHRKPPP